MCEMKNRKSDQLGMIREWLDVIVGDDNNGPVSVKERISYLVVCCGGYYNNEQTDKYSGKTIGPFTIGLSDIEKVEHAYYAGMLAGMDLLGVDPYEILNLHIENYIEKSLLRYDIEIDVSGIIEDDVLDLKRLLGDYNYMSPKHGGDDN